MFEHERSLVKRLAGKPFALIGVNSDNDREETKKKNEKEHITWRSLLYLIDAKGVIRQKFGFLESLAEYKVLDEAIDALMKESEKAAK